MDPRSLDWALVFEPVSSLTFCPTIRKLVPSSWCLARLCLADPAARILAFASWGSRGVTIPSIDTAPFGLLRGMAPDKKTQRGMPSRLLPAQHCPGTRSWLSPGSPRPVLTVPLRISLTPFHAFSASVIGFCARLGACPCFL